MKKRILAILLTALMTVSVIPFAAFADGDAKDDGWYGAYVQKAGEGSSEKLNKALSEHAGDAKDAGYAPTDTVRVSIVLEDKPTIDKFDLRGIAKNKAAISYRTRLKETQKRTAKQISALALGGKTLDVVWNLTLAVNVISANVEYGRIAKIEKVPGVKSVVVETKHEPESVVPGEGAADPKMAISTKMTNTDLSWAKGYTGAGSAIAVIDTGIDADHISFDAGAYEYALGTLDKTVDTVTAKDVEAVLDQLNAKINDPELTVDDLYLNSKIPYAYNYVDQDTNITHLEDTEGEHGSHVAGIAAANRFVPDKKGGYTDALSTVLTQGQAPDAQLFVMKVFGVNGGAYDSDEYAAIEDSIILGADAANLSLGTANAGDSIDETYKELFAKLEKSDTVMSVSASNSFSWSYSTFEGYNYAEDKNLDTVGSPASLESSLSVASVENSGSIAPSFKLFERSVPYNETEAPDRVKFEELEGDYEFIAIDGKGTEEEFASVADVLEGKIALCWRGELNFATKANNAAMNGAAGLIICNNSAGNISMILDDYDYTDPVAIISLEDGEFIYENAVPVVDPDTGKPLYYTGTLSMPAGVEINKKDSDYYAMSDMSSWGVPGALTLKPEITAPGGGIYSVNGAHLDEKGVLQGEGNNAYELMSGTSMAAPQVSGICAIVGEYVRANDLTAKTGLTQRQLTTALLMGTATPLIEEESGNYYSVMKQGAGLVDAGAAIDTHTCITMDKNATASYADGKVKAEIGEISRENGAFGFGFDVNNFGDRDSSYILDAAWFTQDYFLDADYDEEGAPKSDENEQPLTRLYMDAWTAELYAYVQWTVNGETVVREEDSLYDFDADGVYTYHDLSAFADYVEGVTDTMNCLDNADVNGDGTIDYADADLIYPALYTVVIDVPAGEKADVSVNVTLLNIADYDCNGAYVEGYVFVTEYDAEEQAQGVTSSIPVLGFYGSWSDPTMFDYASVVDYYHNSADRAPYLAYQDGYDASAVNGFLIKHRSGTTYYAAGNPYVIDKVYAPERNAINPKDTLDSVKFALIRNSSLTGVVVTDSAGKELVNREYGQTKAAYYDHDADEPQWKSTSVKKYIDYTPSELKDGDVITATLYALPEYYVIKGQTDWSELGAGVSFSQQFTVDGACPEIKCVDVHYDAENEVYDSIKVTAKDDQYIAAVVVEDEDGNTLGIIGSDPEANAGDEYENTFDLSCAIEDLVTLPPHLLVTVADYASNETKYYINLNAEELEGPSSVCVENDAITLPLNSSTKFEATVTPWGRIENVVWSSENEQIVTVDEEGIVTGVGVGTAFVRAALESDPEVFDAVEVTVREVRKAFDGVLWDEEGEVWFVSFNTVSLPDYEKLTKDDLPLELTAVSYDENGTLYGTTFDSSEELSDLYIIDEETFELTYVGSSASLGYFDIAAAPGVSEELGMDLMAGIYASYMVWFDKTDGEYVTVIDLSDVTLEDYLCGVAYAGSYYSEETETRVDEYYLVDESGCLYRVGVTVEETEEYGPDVSVVYTECFDRIGDPIDCPYFQSLYLDTQGELTWARTNTEDGTTEIIFCDLSDPEDVRSFVLGSFAEGVWPVSGIHERGESIAFDYYDTIYGGEPEWHWGEDLTAAKAQFIGEGGAELTLDAEITVKTTPASCEVEGTDAYTATVILGTKTYTDTVTVVTSEALEHEWSEWTVIRPATATEEGLEQRMCARDLKIESRPIPKLAYIPGDVNGDGKVNAKDVTALMKYIVKTKVPVFVEAAADFDSNGKINAKDVTGIMKFIVNNA